MSSSVENSPLQQNRSCSSGAVGAADVSETESDDASSAMGEASSSLPAEASSMDGQLSGSSSMKPPSPAAREHLTKRIDSLLQENRVLKVELETYKLRVRTLQEENKSLRQASVMINAHIQQVKAEQEEEFISNTLMKKIQELKKEKESLALNYEQEEECLTNDLSRKLTQLRNEKAQLATTLQEEQESLVNRLMKKIQKLESETQAKQANLDQLRREKVTLENTLEQEQEALVNRLWKRMDKLEAEKRCLQQKLEQPISAPPSPMDTSILASAHSHADTDNGSVGIPPLTTPAPAVSPLSSATARPTRASLGSQSQTDPMLLAKHIQMLRRECTTLKDQLASSEQMHSETMAQLAREEQHVREENLRLRRKLEMELERRHELCRHLSESESSLEMEDERHFNELSHQRQIPPPPISAGVAASQRGRTISNPHIAAPTGAGRPASPAMAISVNTSLTSAGPCLHNSQNSPATAAGLNSSGGSAAAVHQQRCLHCGSPLVSPALWQHGGVGSLPEASGSQTWTLTSLSSASAAPPPAVLSTSSPAVVQPVFRTKSGDAAAALRSGVAGDFARPNNPPFTKAASPASHLLAPTLAEIDVDAGDDQSHDGK